MLASPSKIMLALPSEQIAAFCRRWSIVRLDVFGSALRPEFLPDSDVDLIATYRPEASWSLLDRVRMKLELEAMLGREVDLLNRRALEKSKRPARVASILTEAQPLYAES